MQVQYFLQSGKPQQQRRGNGLDKLVRKCEAVMGRGWSLAGNWQRAE